MQNENKELQSCLVSWRIFSFTVLLFMIHMRIMLKPIVLLRDYVSVGGGCLNLLLLCMFPVSFIPAGYVVAHNAVLQ